MVAKGANGQIEFQQTQVTINRMGMGGWGRGVKGSKVIPIGSVTAVQAREPGIFIAGYIQLTNPGGVEDPPLLDLPMEGRQAGGPKRFVLVNIKADLAGMAHEVGLPLCTGLTEIRSMAAKRDFSGAL